MVKKRPAAKPKIARREVARKAVSVKVSAKVPVKARVPVKTDVVSVEEETIRRVGRTMASIEEFLAKWDASAVKPDDLFPHVVRIRQFYDALSGWQKEALKDKMKKDQDAIVRRLRDFVLICRTYS